MQAANLNVLGQRSESSKLYKRAAETALRRGLRDAAAGFEEADARADALSGNCRTARVWDVQHWRWRCAASALAGDAANARTAFQDFFALWKDADVDVPILVAAKKEYEKLK